MADRPEKSKPGLFWRNHHAARISISICRQN
jgi:hypothetical protein